MVKFEKSLGDHLGTTYISCRAIKEKGSYKMMTDIIHADMTEKSPFSTCTAVLTQNINALISKMGTRAETIITGISKDLGRDYDAVLKKKNKIDEKQLLKARASLSRISNVSKTLLEEALQFSSLDADSGEEVEEVEVMEVEGMEVMDPERWLLFPCCHARPMVTVERNQNRP